MGFFKKDKKNSERSFSVELKASIVRGTDDTVQKLLKEASRSKRDGDIEGAIVLLKVAYKELNDNSWGFPIEVYLRLPLYLQESGKRDEAWGEFNRLVLWVNSKSRYSREGSPMELSAIWDKMRLFLQREGKKEDAITFGVWSYLSWANGLHAQKRFSELKTYTNTENITKYMNPLLKKAGQESLRERIVKLVSDSSKQLPDLDFQNIATLIKTELSITL
jgi:hypothetical protein